MSIETQGQDNQIEIGSNVNLSGRIIGDRNRVLISDSAAASVVHVFIHGHGNTIRIDKPLYLRGLSIRCGNHVPAHDTELLIAESMSFEAGGSVLLYNSGNRCHIGSHCLFSNNLTIRCGESPHLLFDRHTGEYLDISEGVSIGNHVWIGERVYLTKRAGIPDESVVAACSVVTRRFDEPHVVLAGNPAKVARRDVQWIRNAKHLEAGSVYEQRFAEQAARFPRPR